jgi:hypothetical protein
MVNQENLRDLAAEIRRMTKARPGWAKFVLTGPELGVLLEPLIRDIGFGVGAHEAVADHQALFFDSAEDAFELCEALKKLSPKDQKLAIEATAQIFRQKVESRPFKGGKNGH